MNTGRRHTWTKTLQIGEREVTACADCGAIWNHNNGRAPRCPGKVRVKPRAKENPMNLACYTATITFRGYAADTDELRDRIKRALGTHPTLSLRVDEVVVNAEPYDDNARAKLAYDAYNNGGDPATAGLNYRGERCPPWEDLPPNVQAKWRAAVRR